MAPGEQEQSKQASARKRMPRKRMIAIIFMMLIYRLRMLLQIQPKTSVRTIWQQIAAMGNNTAVYAFVLNEK